MKCLRTIVLFDAGRISQSQDWATVHSSYTRSIAGIDHPRGSGIFTIREKSRRENGQWHRNGVSYLRSYFLENMVRNEGWAAEGGVNLAGFFEKRQYRLYPSGDLYQEPVTSNFGGFDFITTTPGGMKVAIEWETGNISSSHRSMNKLAMALQSGAIQIGVLIVPSRDLYDHLTDRTGNIGELSGYLPLWAGMVNSVRRGLLAISVVEHDELTTSESCPYLEVGNDGRAAEGREKLNIEK